MAQCAKRGNKIIGGAFGETRAHSATQRDCKCSDIPDIFLDVSEDVPMPKTPTIGGEREIRGGGPGKSISFGVIVVVAILVVGFIYIMRLRNCKKSGFYTEYAQEEPTRSYTPYTGAVPYGSWGTTPWAYAFDLASPSDIYRDLPAGYRDPTNVL